MSSPSELDTKVEIAEKAYADTSYGVLSSVQRDNLYWFGERGFLYTSPWVVTECTVRYQATLLLTASRKPFDLSVDGRTRPMDAVAVAPLTPRGLVARDVGQISVHVGFQHPAFPGFRRIGAAGFRALCRSGFDRFDAELDLAYRGALSSEEARTLFEALIDEAIAQLPPSAPPDERCERVRALLREDPEIRLGEIAERLDVSYSTASAVVSEAIGLPLRAYRYGQKCERAARRLLSETPLTKLALEAGFTDSAHLSHSWQRRFGHPPSYVRDREKVRVVV